MCIHAGRAPRLPERAHLHVGTPTHHPQVCLTVLTSFNGQSRLNPGVCTASQATCTTFSISSFSLSARSLTHTHTHCSAAIIPAAVLQYMWGDRATYKFLLIAQVALALQLPVTLVPMIKVRFECSVCYVSTVCCMSGLLHLNCMPKAADDKGRCSHACIHTPTHSIQHTQHTFTQATSSRKWMGSFRNSWLLAFCAWSALGLIFVANLLLLISQMVTGVEGQTPEVLAANLLDQG